MTAFRTAGAVLALAGCWTSSQEPPAAPAAPAAVAPAPPPRPPVPPRLAVTEIEPTRGHDAGGTYVVIKGKRFIADGPRRAMVYFGARRAAVIRFASDTQLIVQAPGGKAGEVVDVRVVFDPGGDILLPAAFTFVPSPP